MNWDDLRIARAVYQAGSFAAAATSLGINETTVARRLSRLQDDLGVILFEAVDGIRRPTAQCEEMLALAEKMAGHAERIGRIGERDVGLVGRRRIATTDSIATEILAPHAVALLAEHPGLSLDFLVSTENVNFSRWEADLAVRFRRPDKGEFVISKLADLTFYLFEPAEGGPGPTPITCAYPEELDWTSQSEFLMRRGLYEHARVRTKNLLVAGQLIRSGHCCGVLPGFMCADLLADDRFTVSKVPEARSTWLLVQPHLKQDAATRAVIDWIRGCFAALDSDVATV